MRGRLEGDGKAFHRHWFECSENLLQKNRKSILRNQTFKKERIVIEKKHGFSFVFAIFSKTYIFSPTLKSACLYINWKFQKIWSCFVHSEKNLSFSLSPVLMQDLARRK